MVFRFAIATMLSGLAVLLSAQQAPLRSPWDSEARAASDAPYRCPEAPSLPHDFATNSYYIDPRHSIIDPALKKKYEDSVAPIDGFARSVVAAADAYRATGSRAAAGCAVNLLAQAAVRKVLSGHMEGHQASYVQGWNLGAWAVAWLKVRSSGAASQQQESEIHAWFKKLAEGTRDYYDEKRRGRRPNDADNNHLYWAAFAIAAAGIANDDRRLFAWGMTAYRQGIGDIRSDGTLPMEMARGQMALHYHLYALAPLVFLAEMGEANGLDLYAERDFAIRRLVARCVAGLEDPALFERQTGIAQVPQEVAGLEASWGTVWTHRFPDAKISALISHARYRGYTELGGLPPQ